MLTTTLHRIREHGPCADGWAKLLAGLGKTQADDEPLPYAEIVRINRLDDALWACRAEPQYSREWRLFAVWCARQVQHLMTDPHSIDALDVAERHASGDATDAELAAAWDAAWAAARGATLGAARGAAWAAAGGAAWAAARAAAWAAAGGATLGAARAAAWAATGAAAWAATGAATGAAARAAQTTEFMRIVTETEARP